ncbi:fluoride efflux transporter CrcB [Nakamurella sp. YIM 132087]|uniref:Fluoride-specific ion channel FluC n=1 Tax=Nakamurella alba TaxID=2665158 RepID=A0A7K1FNF3_9ACTN|nr:fluoride efflux transporter CrcB [Nakamurella alba]MTD14839.1 fluoride efflux transporter CrcB [Nakamurella alba]
MNVLLVVAGAAIGAPLRYLLDRVVQTVTGSGFPLGTMAVNTLGCLVLGLVAGAALPSWAVLLLATGFCGALTTYSTFSFETVRLAERGPRWSAVLNVVGTLVLGSAAVWLGLLITG